jgi:5-methylcytosine-specific restriction endonuclease McrA
MIFVQENITGAIRPNPKKGFIVKVAVVDTNRKPLAPTTPRMAKILLRRGKAAVLRRFPFTLILKKEAKNPTLPDLRLKIDPGAKATGLAIVSQESGEVVFAAEISHRGSAIKASLDSRRALRRSRRNRKTRYRKPRFNNRIRPKGWLAPSLKSRVDNVATWTRRLTRFYPISGIAMELVRFDTQLMENAEIKGLEYQQGELAGYELKEYLLLKWGHECAYKSKGPCDQYLEIEHIVPKSRGGTDRVSNLSIACRKHNQEKGTLTAEEFGFPDIQSQAKKPLKDAAAVNSTRWALFERLKSTGLSIETGSGGLTKFNRSRRELPKEHWVDAACVGHSTPENLNIEGVQPLIIKATGHGSRQMCSTDKYGFPIRHRTHNKTFMGFQTGDMAQANISKGKFAGKHFGRVTIRQRKSFTLNGFDVNPDYLKRVHRTDGYEYRIKNTTKTAG